MMIPLHYDPIKDKELIDWLNTKSNRSAFIRFVLYEYKDRVAQWQPPKEEEDNGFNLDNIMNSVDELG